MNRPLYDERNRKSISPLKKNDTSITKIGKKKEVLNQKENNPNMVNENKTLQRKSISPIKTTGPTYKRIELKTAKSPNKYQSKESQK